MVFSQMEHKVYLTDQSQNKYKTDTDIIPWINMQINKLSITCG